MNFAYAVMKTRAAQGQCGLVEATLVTRAVSQRQKTLHGDAELASIVREITGKQMLVKDIVARRNRRMRGKDCCAGDQLKGGIERQLVVLHLFPAAFQDLEGSMTFIDMPDGRLQAEPAQGANATDAEYDFLLDTGI